jgi:hypothetical protein
VREPVHFIPIVTTVVAIAFAIVVFRRYRDRRGLHLLWWSIGLLLFGVGTGTEAATTVFGWNQGVFRAWYIAGALLGGAPLAQGTVYLLLSRRVADRMTVALLAVVAVAALCVLLTPINYELVESHRLSGRVMEWQWVRAFSPFINLYAAIFLIGGAVFSAVRFSRPGIGGTATRFGHVEVLYVTEFAGLILIWMGYRWNVRTPAARRVQHGAAIAAAPEAS